MSQISENVWPDGEKSHERKGDGKHFVQRPQSFVCEKVKIVKSLENKINTFSPCLYSVSHPFLGDYVRLRQNVQWKKICVENNDQYVVFADIINKIARSSGKVGKLFEWPRKVFKLKIDIQQFVPILLVLSTSSMLLLDQRTLQIKYRVPASEIYRMSLSPYLDDIAVFHVKAVSLFFVWNLLLPIA